VDKRKKDADTGIIKITLDNGKQVNIPKHIMSVFTVLKKKYSLIMGDADMDT
jgi:hypothetical protein